ncbi:cupin domain-containing protein [Streptomyces achromogenes]|uniref:cupin domain-containing protein n=1 Tax=Streptomyces achromogenes TaxID=67255 RepID=UPI0036876E78
MRTALRTAVTGVVTVTALMTCGSAGATPPGPGITSRLLGQTTIDGTDYILREATIPPGQATGWHYHDGPVYGVVRRGTLSHFDATCRSDGVYGPGGTFREQAGPGHVHIGRNLGDTPVVLELLYVLPHGSPLFEDAPNPGCPFQ